MSHLNAPIQASSPDRFGQWFGELRIHAGFKGTTRQKDYVPFHCTACGAGDNGEWHMQLQNVFIGIGCPCCRSIARVRAMFAGANHLAEYKLSAWASPSGKADVGSVRYRLISPDGTGSDEMVRASICAGIREGRVPGGSSIQAQQSIGALMDLFIATFPSGTIEFEAWHLSTTTSPGPFFRISTGTRRMRERVSGVQREQGIQDLIRVEEQDNANHENWSAIAVQHGAIIEGYTHALGSQVKIKYLTRAREERKEAFQRAQNSSWGQTRYKKGEKLCQAVMLSLFPGSTWRWSQRYSFLSLDGHLLELDGYCETLALAFEHQGAQHHSRSVAFHPTVEHFNDLVARDAFKVERCRSLDIRLVVIDAMNLDAQNYLSAICALLREKGVKFEEMVTAKEVDTLWKEICAYPLQQFHAAVIEGLGAHKMLSPAISEVTADQSITYRCSNCGKPNQAMAKGLADSGPRKYCPACKGRRVGDLRRLQHLASLRASLPPEIFARLKSEPDKRLSLRCDRGHLEVVSTRDAILLKHQGVTYNCPHCQTLELGFADSDKLNRLRAAALNQYRPAFEKKIGLAGLTKIAPIAYVESLASLVAHVECTKGHMFSITMSSLTTLLRSKYLGDRRIVPTVCATCCYPGGPYVTKDSTVFHRLEVLRMHHPNASFVSGFDPTGWSKELYACGESHVLSKIQHVGISISYRALASKAKKAVGASFCYECAEERGGIKPSFAKNIAMVRGRMLAIAEAIAKRLGANVVQVPSATIVSDDFDVDGFISTTKTLVRFNCETEGHSPEVKTVDAYFALAGGKPGYCRNCLALAGVKTVNELRRLAPVC